MDSKNRILTIVGVVVIVALVAVGIYALSPDDSDDGQDLPDVVHYSVTDVSSYSGGDVVLIHFEERIMPGTTIVLMCDGYMLREITTAGVDGGHEFSFGFSNPYGLSHDDLREGVEVRIDGCETIRTN